jgi:putative oxidoreductase
MDIDLGLLVLRVVVGLTFAGHGAQKVFGWWSGPGMKGFGGWISGMGVRPIQLFAWAAALAELAGGLLLAAGLLTPIAAAFLVAQSLAIIILVHWKNGFWNTKGGIEFALTLLAAALAVFLTGPGAYSVDAAIGLSLSTPVALVILAVAVAGALVAAFGRATQPAAASS